MGLDKITQLQAATSTTFDTFGPFGKSDNFALRRSQEGHQNIGLFDGFFVDYQGNGG